MSRVPQADIPQITDLTNILKCVNDVRNPWRVLCSLSDGRIKIAPLSCSDPQPNLELLGTICSIYPERLGDLQFTDTHRIRFPYVVGEMAHGITTAHMVIRSAEAGMLGFFGAAGLPLADVEQSIDTIGRALDSRQLSWGSNLIHTPEDPMLEREVVNLYLKRSVRRVSVSAFMGLSPEIVRYSASGLRSDGHNGIHRDNHVFAKISRPEIAIQFMSPAPQRILDELVREGRLRQEEANLARFVAVAEDITAEADSGGHTDNRPLAVLFPAIAQERDRITQQNGYQRPIRVGAAGGLGTPSAIAAAFALGAAYVLTGSINQTAIESGLSNVGRMMLAEAGIADITMAPSADMFEQGVRVQVLRRGSMYAARSGRLYELYRKYHSIEEIPSEIREQLERDIFRRPLENIWQETRRYFLQRDPNEIARAEQDPHRRMALTFRWYLGLSSRWPIAGDPDRKLDYQLWAGPALGAFNGWTSGSFLADLQRRTVAQIGLNLLEGAAVITRAHQLRCFGVDVPTTAFSFTPRPLTPDLLLNPDGLTRSRNVQQ